MTQLDKITDPIGSLEAETDAVSSRSDQRRKDCCNLTEKPEDSESTVKLVLQHDKATAKKPRTKKVVLISMLSRKSGATMQAMMDATSWQAHSLRAALSGLRKSGRPAMSKEPAESDKAALSKAKLAEVLLDISSLSR